MEISQTTVLDEAAKTHPNSWWWLKADGCDVTEGLMESTKLVWNGDVDLNDGKLLQQYEAYRTRLASVEKVGLEGQKDVAAQLASILKDLANDLTFIHSGKTENVIPDFIATNILCIIALAKASQCYSEKQEAGKSREKHLVYLAWKVKELSDLNESGRKLSVDVKCLLDKVQDLNWVRDNVPRRLSVLRQRIITFIRSTIHATGVQLQHTGLYS